MFPDLILLASAELPPSNAERPVIWCGACCRPAAGQWLQPLSAISCTDYGDVWRCMGNVAGKHGFYRVTFKKHPYTWVFIWSIFEIFYNMLTSTSLNQFFGQEVWPDWSASGPRQLRPPILGPNQWQSCTAYHPTSTTGPTLLCSLSSVIWHLASLHDEVPWGPCPLSIEAMNLFCPPQTLAQLGVSSAFQRGSWGQWWKIRMMVTIYNSRRMILSMSVCACLIINDIDKMIYKSYIYIIIYIVIYIYHGSWMPRAEPLPCFPCFTWNRIHHP